MSNDPFAFDDDDKTVLQPVSKRQNPKAGSRQANTAQTQQSAGISQAPLQANSIPLLGGINQLEKAASRLIPLLITIKNSQSHPNPEQLRNKLINELNDFKQRAHAILEQPEKVTQASYVMCTVLDEAAMNTPWGHESNWSQHNLLATFHNEVMGGERFFTLLQGLGKNPKENIELLELMYVCLSLGYEGSYRIAQNGKETLVKIRHWLYDIIQTERQKPNAALSTQWEGSGVKESRLPKLTPVWVILAAALGIASFSYMGLRYKLSNFSDSVVAGYFNSKVKPLSISTIVPPAKPRIISTETKEVSVVTLTDLMQADIDNGAIEVNETFEQGQVRILGSNLFESGSVSLNSNFAPLIERISKAINQFDGTVIITGHSDNVPIRSGRFASNLELSQARADSVMQFFSRSQTDAARVSSIGKGSLEPIADNSTAAGRNSNRRVEISIYY